MCHCYQIRLCAAVNLSDRQNNHVHSVQLQLSIIRMAIGYSEEAHGVYGHRKTLTLFVIDFEKTNLFRYYDARG